jgi:MFS family permease
MIVNLFASAVTAQLALFATQRLGADNSKVGYLYAASSLGIVALSFVVGPANRRFSLSNIIVLALCLYGGGVIVFGLFSTYSVALVAWGVVGGASALYNVSTITLRQRIIPNELLGRVWNIMLTGSWCAVPVGSLLGGAVVELTHDVQAVYIAVGVLIMLVGLIFNCLWLRYEPDRSVVSVGITSGATAVM